MVTKIEINLTNRWLYSLTLVGIILILSVSTYAAYTQSIPNPGHGADSVLISINGAEKTLQEAINDNDFTSTGTLNLGAIQDTNIGQIGGNGASLNVSDTAGTIHQAATDGMVMLWKTSNGKGSLFIGETENTMIEVLRTDVRQDAYGHSLGSALVKQGEYWQITKVNSGTVITHWRPLN